MIEANVENFEIDPFGDENEEGGSIALTPKRRHNEKMKKKLSSLDHIDPLYSKKTHHDNKFHSKHESMIKGNFIKVEEEGIAIPEEAKDKSR